MILLGALLCSGAAGFAQAASIGSIGKRTIDNTLLQSIQQVYPDFSFVFDTTALKAQLQKSYVLNSYLAGKAKTEIGKEDSLWLKIQEAQQLIAAKIAGEYLYNLYLSKVTVTESEIKAYYETEKQRFTTYARVSYIYAYMNDTMPATLKRVREVINGNKQLSAQQLANSKSTEANFSVSYEAEHEINPYSPMQYELMRFARPATWIGPVQPVNSTGYLIYYILSAKPESIMPFEQVKEDCAAQALAAKRAMLTQKLHQAANDSLPVHLNAAFFDNNSKGGYEVK
ncbi:MAG: peptidylprolyl isomerase [Chitinophagales bacterium]